MKPELSHPPLPAAVRAEAAAWVARLHSSSRSHELGSGLRKWLNADPAHARAFELATEAWEIGGSIPGAALPRMADPFHERVPARRSARKYLAIAAALSAVAAGAVVFLTRDDSAVTTSVGEQRMLTLDDGTRIFLNTNTRLFVRQDAVQRRVQLESGEAMFDVTRDPHRAFVVAAGDKEVIALGTSFVIRHDPQLLTVTVMEGKVAVSPTPAVRSETPATLGHLESKAAPAGKTVLAHGQRLTFVSQNPPTLDEPPTEIVTAWRRGEVILDKTRLQDAVEEMNRYSVVKLVIDDAAVGDIRVSGIFRAGDSARFAQAVGETYHVAVDHEPRRIRISAAGP